MYIENDCHLCTVSYLFKYGVPTLYFVTDEYCVTEAANSFNVACFSSSIYTEYYLENMNKNVQKMLVGMGIRNGTTFIQTLPYQGKLYFMEMGFRMDSDMMFKLIELQQASTI